MCCLLCFHAGEIKVTIPLVARVVSEVYGSSINSCGEGLPLQQKMAVCSFLLLTQGRKKKEVELGKVCMYAQNALCDFSGSSYNMLPCSLTIYNIYTLGFKRQNFRGSWLLAIFAFLYLWTAMFCHCTRAQSKFLQMAENLRIPQNFSHTKIKVYTVAETSL